MFLAAIPDDYYNPTTADLRKAQATLTARTQALTNAPLQTRAMRASVERTKKERWPSVSRLSVANQFQIIFVRRPFASAFLIELNLRRFFLRQRRSSLSMHLCAVV
jgi:hypothetical protein